MEILLFFERKHFAYLRVIPPQQEKLTGKGRFYVV